MVKWCDISCATLYFDITDFRFSSWPVINVDNLRDFVWQQYLFPMFLKKNLVPSVSTVIASRKVEVLGCRNTGEVKTWENGGMAAQIVNHRTTTDDH